jgi:hypothetical protein
VDLLEHNVDTMKKNAETLIEASKEVGLEVNTEKLSVCCRLRLHRWKGGREGGET